MAKKVMMWEAEDGELYESEEEAKEAERKFFALGRLCDRGFSNSAAQAMLDAAPSLLQILAEFLGAVVTGGDSCG